MIIRVCLSVILLQISLFAVQTHAQKTKIPVSVDHSGDDALGVRLAYRVREEIRRSDGYSLEVTEKAIFHISLITMDPTEENNYTACALAFTVRNFLPYKDDDPQTWLDIHLTHMLVTAGENKIDNQAKLIVAEFDRQFEYYRKSMN